MEGDKERARRHIQRATQLMNGRSFGAHRQSPVESFGGKKRRKRSYTVPISTKVPLWGFNKHHVERVTSKNRSEILTQLQEYLKTYTSGEYYDGWELDELLDAEKYPTRLYEIYVLRYQNTVIGFCGISKPTRNLFYLFVFEKFRLHGAGTALVHASNAYQWHEIDDAKEFWQKFNTSHTEDEILSPTRTD